MTYDDCITEIRNARLGSQIRDSLIQALEYIGKKINVDMPSICQQCGAPVSGKSANCEYCGSLLIWRNEKDGQKEQGI